MGDQLRGLDAGLKTEVDAHQQIQKGVVPRSTKATRITSVLLSRKEACSSVIPTTPWRTSRLTAHQRAGMTDLMRALRLLLSLVPAVSSCRRASAAHAAQTCRRMRRRTSSSQRS